MANLLLTIQALMVQKLTGSEWALPGCECESCKTLRRAHETDSWPGRIGCGAFSARAYPEHAHGPDAGPDDLGGRP